MEEMGGGEGVRKREEVCFKERQEFIARQREWSEWKRSERGDACGTVVAEGGNL